MERLVPGIGFSRSFGWADIPQEPLVKYGGADVRISTRVKYLPMNVLNLSIQRQFLSKRGNRLVLEFGYSLPLSETKVEFSSSWAIYDGQIISTEGLEFTDVAKLAHRFQNPAGLLLGVSYHFGFAEFK